MSCSMTPTEKLYPGYLGSAAITTHRFEQRFARTPAVRPMPSAKHCAEHLLDGETRFFRYPAAFESLAKVVLPELETRKSAENPRSLRILSAGCSTGEEPYSIGMSVCEVVNCSSGGWNVHIVASDIRRQALETASAASTRKLPSKQFPHHPVQAYFAKVGDASCL